MSSLSVLAVWVARFGNTKRGWLSWQHKVAMGWASWKTRVESLSWYQGMNGRICLAIIQLIVGFYQGLGTNGNMLWLYSTYSMFHTRGYYVHWESGLLPLSQPVAAVTVCCPMSSSVQYCPDPLLAHLVIPGRPPCGQPGRLLATAGRRLGG